MEKTIQRVLWLFVLAAFWVGSTAALAAEGPATTRAGAEEKKVQKEAAKKAERIPGIPPGGMPKPPDKIHWVAGPARKLPPGVEHGTFLSKAMKTQVGYCVYKPPAYESGTERYPVIYWLHGIGGNETRGLRIAAKLHEAIVAGQVPPMMMVLPNGGQFTFYCDSADGKILSETVIIKELIPHIDAGYRTIASRKGRAIEGASMGAFGAAHLGLKYPELFCSVLSGSPAILTPEVFAAHMPEVYQMLFNADAKACQAQSPYRLAEKNAEAIRRNLTIMLAAGTRDWAFCYGEKFHAHLEKLKIPHRYEVLEGAGHGQAGYYRGLGAAEIFNFHAKAFGLKIPTPPRATLPSSKAGK